MNGRCRALDRPRAHGRPVDHADAARYASRILRGGIDGRRRAQASALPRQHRPRDLRRRRVRARDRGEPEDFERPRPQGGRSGQPPRAAHGACAGRGGAGGGALDRRQGHHRPDGLAVAPASAPPEVAEIIAAGNRIATKPYKYGGGHGRWRDSGYDCSGSVSYALHGGGLLDTQLDSSALAWLRQARPGQAGHGPGQRRARLHGGGRPALRHERRQAHRQPLDGEDALGRGYAGRHPAGL